MKDRFNCILDSSFWINICKIGLSEYLFKYFNLFSSKKVFDELSIHSKSYIYLPQDYLLFQKYVKEDLIIIKKNYILKDVNLSLSKDSGEVYTISLAKKNKYIVLMDDNGPLKYCIKNKIEFLTSIHFLIFLYKKNELSKTEVLDKILKLKNSINENYIIVALKYLDKEVSL